MDFAPEESASAPHAAPAGRRRIALPAWLPVLVLWAALFSVSCRLTGALEEAAAPGPFRSVTAAVLGQSRLGLARHFYEIADLYFHRGVHHLRKQAFADGFFRRALHEVAPSDHVHLQGQGVREMMPWLWLTIRMDPRYAEPYLVAAFWLARDGRRPDLALDVLREAQCAIPFDYEIQLEKGRICLRQGDLAGAKQSFDAGLAFWPSGQMPDSADARQNRAALLLYRALLHEVDGEKRRAIAALEEILALFPERTELRDRIETLQRGGEPSLLASALWTDMLREHDTRRTACPHEDHAHADPHAHGP